MANLIRSAKSGNDWMRNELLAYRIRIEYQTATTFFGAPVLPDPQVDRQLLVAQTADQVDDEDKHAVINLLVAMDLAMPSPPDEESAVDDFALQLFLLLGYANRRREVRTRKDLPLFVCGQRSHAKTDVCIVDISDPSHVVLLVQEDKRHLSDVNPQPQLVAEAIAAFDNNNSARERFGRPTLQSAIIPGITMTGTMPTFFKIPVTTELVQAVAGGTYPEKETVVYAHLSEIPGAPRAYEEGMRNLMNRHIILSCYEAFRPFIQ